MTRIERQDHCAFSLTFDQIIECQKPCSDTSESCGGSGPLFLPGRRNRGLCKGNPPPKPLCESETTPKPFATFRCPSQFPRRTSQPSQVRSHFPTSFALLSQSAKAHHTTPKSVGLLRNLSQFPECFACLPNPFALLRSTPTSFAIL